MITAMISRLMILAFGTLYPAYASYKAVRTKDVKEYVKWMMYWIVFAFFTCAETFTDVFFSFWFPFYYEIKVALVFWLLSPATKGSSFLYRNFVHPALQRRESEIDEMLTHAREKGYNTVLSIGSKGVTYATNVLLQTAMRGGGGLVEHIKKSYSLTDLAPKVPTSNQDFIDAPSEPRPTRGRRGIVGSAANLEMRFAEVDVNIRQCPANDMLSDIRSSEDISSGYSSTDQLYTEGVLTRSSSVSSTRARGRGGRTVQTRRAPLGEEMKESDVESENSSSIPSNLSNTQNISSPISSLVLESLSSGKENSSSSSAVSKDNKMPLDRDNIPMIDEETEDELVELNVNNVETSKLVINLKSLNDENLEKDLKNDNEKNDKESGIKLIVNTKETKNENLDNISTNNELQKCSSQISLNSTSSITSIDSERKGKYKKLPAPRPPSRELVENFMELTELEEKLSETEILMKKINDVNNIIADNSLAEEIEKMKETNSENNMNINKDEKPKREKYSSTMV